MSSAELSCHKCGHKTLLGAQEKIARRDTCLKCGFDLHVCLNCHFYDKNAHRECRESLQEAVKDKEKSNFCDLFRPRSTLSTGSSTSGRENLLNAAEALFKKK